MERTRDSRPLQIAVLVNTSPGPMQSCTKESWKRAFHTVKPTAVVEFFDIVVEQEYPDCRDYDLIVLTGGSADPRSQEPWVLKMMEYIRITVSECKTRLLGVCWGHQAICQALGGEIEDMANGPVAAISSIKLTAEGRAFLGVPTWKTHFTAPEFHVRWVSKPPDNGFIAIAEDHQAYIYHGGRIFTFQAHLEMNEADVKGVIEHTTAYTANQSAAELDQLVKKASNHDGLKILQRIIDWAEAEDGAHHY